jgi:hypothetical protein
MIGTLIRRRQYSTMSTSRERCGEFGRPRIRPFRVTMHASRRKIRLDSGLEYRNRVRNSEFRFLNKSRDFFSLERNVLSDQWVIDRGFDH